MKGELNINKGDKRRSMWSKRKKKKAKKGKRSGENFIKATMSNIQNKVLDEGNGWSEE